MSRQTLPIFTLIALSLVSCLDNPLFERDSGVFPDASNTIDTTPDVVDTSLKPRSVDGDWIAGDFHVHATGASNDTGGDSFPEDIKRVAIERGLQVVVLTDHSNSTGSDTTTTDEDPALFNMGPEFPYWAEVAALSDDDFLMVDGNEMSPIDENTGLPTGHIGCYPRDLSTFDPNVAFIDRPRGMVSGGDTIDQAKAAGCFATLNHPFGPTPWIAFDWTSYDYDAIEVFNGSVGWDGFDERAVKAWACDLSVGRSVTAIGGSDNHRVNIVPPGDTFNPPLGRPTTWIFAPELSWPNIVGGLDSGAVSITDTTRPLDLDAYSTDGTWLAMPGGSIAAGSTRMRVQGSLDHSEGEVRVLQVLRVTTGDCDDPRAEKELLFPEPNWEIVFETVLEPDAPFSHEFSLDAGAGEAIFAWFIPDGGRQSDRYGVGLTNAILVY